MGAGEMDEERPTEWRCLAGGNPEFGYTASTVVNRAHIVSGVKESMPEALEDLRLKAEAALRESGDQRKLTMLPPWQKRAA
jgi:hypothetical protein